jgi:hypothetical protein
VLAHDRMEPTGVCADATSSDARQFRPAAQQLGYDVLGDIGFEILREFWLETPRKLKFPCVRKPQSGTPILSAAKFAHIPNV